MYVNYTSIKIKINGLKNKIKGLNLTPKTIKLLEENISCRFFDTGLDNFFGCVYSGKRNKTENKSMGLYQTKNLLHSKGNY